MFEEGIEIIARFPDLGQCTQHWEDINRVCLQKQCNPHKYFCEKCSDLHIDHKSIKNSGFVKQITDKFRNNRPAKESANTSIVNSLRLIADKFDQFLIQMSNTFKLLKQLNLSDVNIISEILKCKPQNLQQLIIQNGLQKNPNYFDNLSKKWDKLGFDNLIADKFYQSKAQKTKQNIDKLTRMMEIVMNNFLELNPAFSIQQNQLIQFEKQQQQKVNTQIKNKDEQKNKQQKLQQQNKEKQKKQDQQKKQNKQKQKQNQKQKMKEEMKEEMVGQWEDVCLRQQDLVADIIIERLQKYKEKAERIRTLDLEGNSVYSDGLQKLLKNKSKLFPNVQRLNLKGCYLDDYSFDVLQASDISTLKYLNIAQNFMEITDARLIKLKSKWPGIDLQTN